MNFVDLQGKGFAILGLRGTGKTYLAKYLLKQNPRSIVYDVLHEYQGLNRYIVEYRQAGKMALQELNLFIGKVVINSGKIKLFVLEEANRYCPPKPSPLPLEILELNDFGRHFGVSFGVIARRPTQLHSDLIELADYLFIFQLKGKNDILYLNSLAQGLGDAVLSLPQYQFVIVYPNHTFQVHEAVSLG